MYLGFLFLQKADSYTWKINQQHIKVYINYENYYSI